MAGTLKRPLSQFERELYERNVLLPEIGEEGQSKLLAGKVLVVGLGGLGSPAVLYLAAAGVGELGLLDGDTVSLSNLQRQVLHGRGDLGRSKVGSASETLLRLNPDVSVRCHETWLNEDNASAIISCYDFVIEATDNFESKFLVKDTCARAGVAFSHAGILGGFGQAMTVVPGAGPCYRCIFQDVPQPGTYESTDRAGVLGSAAGVMGTIQAAEAVKFLVGAEGLLVGRLLTFDIFEMRFREVRLPSDKRCNVCGGVA